MKPAVFLDRDNTLIHNDGDLGDPKLVRLMQGAASAVASLKGLNYQVVVVSNQGGVARGKYETTDVNNVNDRVNDLIKSMTGASIDRFYYCPFHPDGVVEKYKREHSWRKPAPGMLLQAAKDLDIDLEKSWMIGDSLRDVAAGAAAGTRTIFLVGEEGDPNASFDDANGADDIDGQVEPDFVVHTLIEAVRVVAQKRSAMDHGRMDTTNHVHRLQDNEKQEPKPKTTSIDPKVASLVTSTKPESTSEVKTIAKTQSKPKQPTKPFRPWNVGPSKQEENKQPAATVDVKPAAESKASEQEQEKQVQPQVVTRINEQIQTPHPSTTTEPATESEQSLKQDSNQQIDDSSIPIEVTMRQILQELRSRRHVSDDFSFLKMFAVVLQIVAFGILLLALMFVGDKTDAFVRYLGIGLMVQLATIAILLFNKK